MLRGMLRRSGGRTVPAYLRKRIRKLPVRISTLVCMAQNLGGSNRLLTVEEAAALLGLSRKALYNAWRDLGLRKVDGLGRRVRFRERDVRQIMES
jgi:excisionase family DNA binding protein